MMTINKARTIKSIGDAFGITDGADLAIYSMEIDHVLRHIQNRCFTQGEDWQGLWPSDSVVEAEVKFLKYLFIATTDQSPLFDIP